MHNLLTARGLTMQYPGVRALNGVDFTLRAGEIHALCGENGAGKSTLIKILGGVTPTGAHGGTVELNGAPCHFAGPGDALRAGIRVIHQELALCPDMTVAENVFLGDEIMRGGLSWGVPDSQRMEYETRVALDSLGLHDLATDAHVGGLPVGLRQMVEIARALKISNAPSNPHKENVSSRRSESERDQEGEERHLRSTNIVEHERQKRESPRLVASRRNPTPYRDAHSPAHARVLILDEPTSALSAREAERLMETLQRLRDNGLGILYISHRLDEVFRLADRITILRGGETTGTMERTSFGEPYDAARVVALMTGGTTAAARFTAAAAAASEKQSPPILSVRDWTVTDPANPARRLVDAVSFDLHAGEILGFAGLMGAGRTELMESLCGLQPGGATLQGSLLLDGKPYAPRDAAHAQRHGIALVCEDRRARGLFADKSVRVNMTVSALRNFCTLGWLTRERSERVEAQARVQSLHVKTPGTEFIAGNLSGGNQQKALLARALLTKPRILILDEPTRGIDVGAKEELYTLIAELASSGMAVLLVSSETSEVLRLAHRVIVMRAGRAAAQRPASTLTLEETLALASGGTVA